MKTKIAIALITLIVSSCGNQPINTEGTASWKSPLGSYYGTSMSMSYPAPPLKKVWETKLSAYSKSSPVCAGGVVVVSDESGTVYCFEDKQASLLWKREMEPLKAMQPVIGVNTVYICDGSATLHCLDINTGNTLWTAQLESNATGWPVIGDGRVWACANQTLYCFEESKGAKIFSKDYGLRLTKTPTMQLHMYLVAGKKLLAVVPETGEKVWEQEFPREIIAPASCTRSEIFVVDGSLNKLDGSTGKILQTYTNDLFNSKDGKGWDKVPSLEQPFTCGASFYLNMLCIGSKSGEILGFMANDISHYVFYHKINFSVTSSPVLTPDFIWFTAPDIDDSGRFFCIANALNAKWVWHDWYDEPVSSHPAITDESFFILTEQGRLVKYSTGGKNVNPANETRNRGKQKQP